MKTFNIRSGFIPQRADDWSFEMFEPYIKVGRFKAYQSGEDFSKRE